MTKLFKALGATLLAAGLVVAGVATPAQAATSGSISTNTFVGGSTIATTLTIDFADTAPGSSTYMTINMQSLNLPSSCSSSTPSTTLLDCGISTLTINGAAPSAGTTVSKTNPVTLVVTPGSALAISSMSITFAANQLTVGSNPTGTRTVIWQAVIGGSAVQQTNFTVTAPVYTVTFKANGGTGSDYTQNGSGNTALNANTFTRANYTFAGWALSANGSPVATDGGNYNITGNVNLYAKWTSNSSGGGSSSSSSSSASDTLANTGINSTNGTLFFLGGLSLAIIGAEMIMIARRKRSN